MSQNILLDTDVIIDYLRDFKPASDFIEKLSGQALLSAITVAELYAGARNATEKQALESFISAFEVIPVDQGIAQLGGEFRKKYGKSHGTGLADALIAACAIQRKATLATLNIRHYPMLKTIKPYNK